MTKRVGTTTTHGLTCWNHMGLTTLKIIYWFFFLNERFRWTKILNYCTLFGYRKIWGKENSDKKLMKKKTDGI